MADESNEQTRRATDSLTPVIIQRLESLERAVERLTDKIDKKDEATDYRLRDIDKRLTQVETRILLWGGGSLGLVALIEAAKQVLAK